MHIFLRYIFTATWDPKYDLLQNISTLTRWRQLIKLARILNLQLIRLARTAQLETYYTNSTYKGFFFYQFTKKKPNSKQQAILLKKIILKSIRNSYYWKFVNIMNYMKDTAKYL